jgi:MFS family permease
MLSAIHHLHHQHRSFWDLLRRNEMAHVYASMIIKNLALALTSLFVPVFLLESGYNLADVAWFLLAYFFLRILGFNYFLGKITARFGAKAMMILSFIFTAIALLLVSFQSEWRLPLTVLGAIYGFASTMMIFSFDVEFSKIHTVAHTGSQLGWLRVVEKFGSILGPVAGGVIATFFGGEYIFVVGLILMILAGLPLLLVKTKKQPHQPFTMRGFPWRDYLRTARVYCANGIQVVTNGPVWPLYMALFIAMPVDVYFGLGLLSSLSVVVALVASLTIGYFVDRHRRQARKVLRAGVIGHSVLDLARPWIGGYSAALALNLTSEVADTAMAIPYCKGIYDESNNNRRIQYFVFLTTVDSITKGLFWLGFWLLTFFLPDLTVFQIAFVVAAVVVLFVTQERFKALR